MVNTSYSQPPPTPESSALTAVFMHRYINTILFLYLHGMGLFQVQFAFMLNKPWTLGGSTKDQLYSF